MLSSYEKVDIALADLKAGKMVILIDAPHRENEGDLIIAAEKMTPEKMNFMIRNGSGIVCVSMTAAQLSQLNLPLMIPEEDMTDAITAFTVSLDAKNTRGSGVSAMDRTITILELIKNTARAHDFIKPGHVFPLRAKENGVLDREGHTEGAMDLVKLAGLTPAAVLCELMNEDGSMKRGQQLDLFASEHGINIVSVQDIISYRS